MHHIIQGHHKLHGSNGNKEAIDTILQYNHLSSDNALLPDGAKPLHESMLTNH